MVGARRSKLAVLGLVLAASPRAGAQATAVGQFPQEGSPAASAGPTQAAAAPPSSAAAVIPAPRVEPAPVVAPPPLPSAPPPPPATPPAVREPARNPSDAKRAANWNLGAGLFGSDGLGGFAGLAGLGVSTPAYRLTLERRLGDRTWLGLSAQLSYTTFDSPLVGTSSAPGERTEVRSTRFSTAAVLGLRQVFVSSVVEVSGYVGAFVGYESYGGDQLRDNEQASGLARAPGSSAEMAGVILGMAVERELIDALAVRLSADLLSARVEHESRVQRDQDGAEAVADLDNEQVSLELRPGIALQFYF